MVSGAAKERQFKNALEDEYGWAAVRIGASGSATDRNLPDILAGDGGKRCWAIEVKYRSSKTLCYEDAEKARDLVEFATRFGAVPIYAVRYSTRLDGVEEADWRIAPAHVARANEVDSGVKLHHSIVSDWPLLSEVA